MRYKHKPGKQQSQEIEIIVVHDDVL